MAKPRITVRTAERLIRAAYNMETLSARLRAAGFGMHADSIQQIASMLGDTGRDLFDNLESGE